MLEAVELRNLTMAQGHLIMAPILKLPHQHQSGSYLEELHDLRLCRPPWIKPFITCWHSCPVLNACTPWESDEASETWWVTDNLRSCKGWPTARRGKRGAGRALPALPTASPGRRHHLGAALAPWPLSPEVADSRRKRNRPQQMGPLTLAGTSEHCVLVTCHLLLFSGLTTLQDRAFQFWVRHKRERARKSWRGLSSLRLKFSERAGTKRRTRLRANKSEAHPQKAAVHPHGSPHHSPYKTPLGPQEVIKRSVPTHRNVCKESAHTKAICNFTKWQT